MIIIKNKENAIIIDVISGCTGFIDKYASLNVLIPVISPFIPRLRKLGKLGGQRPYVYTV